MCVCVCVCVHSQSALSVMGCMFGEVQKYNVLEHQGLLDSMIVCVMMCCQTKLYAYNSILLTFATGLQGQSHVVFLDCLVLLICPYYITLHLGVQQG
jgi:hypothetical protein